MLWGAPIPENLGSPIVLENLLKKALESDPEDPAVLAKLGYLSLDRKDFRAAAEFFGSALRLRPNAHDLPVLLARCLNYLGRHDEVLQVLAHDGDPHFERCRALMECGDLEEAEREFRAVLARRPDDVGSCRMLCRILRRSERPQDLLALCEDLAMRGASNAQFLFNWGIALAFNGDFEKARKLMLDPARIVAIELQPPPAFPSIGAFNDALAEEILANPNRVTAFPLEDEANRGSSRVDDLFSGRQPQLITLLLDLLQQAVERIVPQARGGFDPWPGLRPAAARMRPWGLIQQGDAYEEGHIHAGGWLSGVYYVRIPRSVSQGNGPGCIEFTAPNAVAERFPDLVEPRRFVPREGLLLLAPSHYQHRTIPSGLAEHRISVAFDVVPDRVEALD